jgi:hypothetical protein
MLRKLELLLSLTPKEQFMRMEHFLSLQLHTIVRFVTIFLIHQLIWDGGSIIYASFCLCQAFVSGETKFNPCATAAMCSVTPSF